ncbi:sugar transferase [Campylobacter sp. faydin G-24]|uniref:Sugar transferase n=1 Tax=Campylobacter anatolicus TaxID=2829105 RepID=A0ABS5HHI8_9BACT|nr:sugar transferase [Campylobacter anatolicus]MBR8462173.1 sugar transferase [Campylobacter anatolicus]MBR8463710.1 sugar transferase [Campylobacter anatolicus]MBR8466378.1 sugar transferase [Campylobacter anatolicus]
MNKSLSFFILLLVDMLFVSACIVLSVITRNVIQDYNFFQDIFRYANLMLIQSVVIFLFIYQGIYTRRYDFWHESGIIVKSCLLGLLISLAVLALIKINYDYSRMVFVLSFIFMMFFLPISKFMLKKWLFRFGIWRKRAKVLGESGDFELEIFTNHYLGYVRAKDKDYDSLFIGSSSLKQETLNELIEQNIRANKEIIFIPMLRSYDFTQAHIYTLFDSRTNLFAIQNSLKSKFNMALKRLLDIGLIVLALPILVPVFLIIMGIIKFKEPSGRIFFSHERMGLNGKHFGCLKFRSMIENSGQILKDYLDKNPQEIEHFEKYHKYENDPRITAFGNFIRKTSLDELPQLINVLKGEMSIVGPRPCAEYERKDMGKYAELILAVRPGMTGLSQVSGRSNVDFETRAQMDAWYMKNWSIWNDIIIIIKTFKVVLKQDGAS